MSCCETRRTPTYTTCFATLVTLQWQHFAARFDAERRQDQTHIAGLVHDANAVEVALRRGLRNGHHHHRNRPVYARGDSDSAGGSIGTTASSKSNAYVESEPKEDPNFISLDQASTRMHTFRRHGTSFQRTHIYAKCLLAMAPPGRTPEHMCVALTFCCLGSFPCALSTTCRCAS